MSILSCSGWLSVSSCFWLTIWIVLYYPLLTCSIPVLFHFSCYLFNCMVRLYKNHTPAYLSLILILHNSVTIIMATNNCCFKVRWNHVYFVFCFTSGRNRVWFLWIEQQKVTKLECHSQSNLRECKVTNDSIIHLVIIIVNVGLNNRHCKILINMTSQVDIDSETKAVVIPSSFFMQWTWRWCHCIKFDSGLCTRYVLYDVSVHELVKCILSLLEKLVHGIPILAWKSIFHTVKTRLDNSFCPPWLWAYAAIFITPFSEYTGSVTSR